MYSIRKIRLRRSNVTEPTVLYATQEEKEREPATRKTSRTGYRAQKAVEREISTKEKPRTARTSEDENIWKNTTGETPNQPSTTTA